MYISIESENRDNEIRYFEFNNNCLSLFFDNYFYFEWESEEEKLNFKKALLELSPSKSLITIDEDLLSKPTKIDNLILENSERRKIDSYKVENKNLIFNIKESKLYLSLSKELKEQILDDINWN